MNNIEEYEDQMVVNFIGIVKQSQWIYNPHRKISNPQSREKKWDELQKFLSENGIRLDMGLYIVIFISTFSMLIV